MGFFYLFLKKKKKNAVIVANHSLDHSSYIYKYAVYVCCVVIYILLISCERKQTPGCASNLRWF